MNDKIYTDLLYIDSLDDGEFKAEALLKWSELYLDSDMKFDLSIEHLEALDELFYKNISFLNTYLENLQKSISEIDSIKKFHEH